MRRWLLTLGLLALAIPAVPVLSQAAAPAPLKIGFISTFSGAEGVTGRDLKAGFDLALDNLGNKLGDRPVKMFYGDDQLKPNIGRQLAQQMIQSDGVDLMTGINFSNVLLGTVPVVTKAGMFYVGVNAGAHQYAGKDCNPLFFTASFENDMLFQSVGIDMNREKVPSVFMIAPNYPAGHDMLNGFKDTYKGKILGEVYTSFPQMDFAGQIADIRAKKPAAVMLFLPGGMGINFVKQYRAAGLTIPLYTGMGSIDATTIPALGKAALGIHVITIWTADLDNAANKKFVSGFEAKYHRLPSEYAADAYDTVNLLNAAVTMVHGNIADKKAFSHALMTAKFASVRGPFRFNTNHYPILDFYRAEVAEGPHGTIMPRYQAVAVKDLHDTFSHECHMPAL